MSAKTSTAEVVIKGLITTNGWMVGYRNDIAFAVIVEGGQSGSKAAGQVASCPATDHPSHSSRFDPFQRQAARRSDARRVRLKLGPIDPYDQPALNARISLTADFAGGVEGDQVQVRRGAG